MGKLLERHTRTSTEAGPDYCKECSDAVQEWVQWPCSPEVVAKFAREEAERELRQRELHHFETEQENAELRAKLAAAEAAVARHGECICNTGPGTEGPDEFCPRHGRTYEDVVRMGAEEIFRLRAEVRTAKAQALREYAEELKWVRPDTCPCDHPEDCCGSVESCDAMQPHVRLVGVETLLAAADRIEREQP
jgi:hypothetical protein